MREVSPGDLIFSFSDTYLRAVGIAQSYCYECPKPLEFGAAGMAWDNVGWRVDVTFKEESDPIRPKDHIDALRSKLPLKYSPLGQNGDGRQSVYLTEVPTGFAEALAQLMGRDVLDLVRGNIQRMSSLNENVGASPPPTIRWEQEIVSRIRSDSTVKETEKEQLIMARSGQGAFRRNVRRLESRCRVTKVDREEHLRASHCKPWRDSSNEERLDGENGLMLTPTIDHLFDRGFISFEDNGRLIVSAVAHRESLERMGVPTDTPVNVGGFSDGQKRFLDFHREYVFLARHR